MPACLVSAFLDADYLVSKLVLLYSCWLDLVRASADKLETLFTFCQIPTVQSRHRLHSQSLESE